MKHRADLLWRLIRCTQAKMSHPRAKHLGMSILISQTLVMAYFSQTQAQPMRDPISPTSDTAYCLKPIRPTSFWHHQKRIFKSLAISTHRANMRTTHYQWTPHHTLVTWHTDSIPSETLHAPWPQCQPPHINHMPSKPYVLDWHCGAI